MPKAEIPYIRGRSPTMTIPKRPPNENAPATWRGRCSIGGGRRTLGRRAIFPESSRLANGTRRRESPVTLRVLLGGRYASSNRFDGSGEPYFEEASATLE